MLVSKRLMVSSSHVLPNPPAPMIAVVMATCTCRKPCHSRVTCYFLRPETGKFEVRRHESHMLRHLENSCVFDSPTSRCSGCPAGRRQLVSHSAVIPGLDDLHFFRVGPVDQPALVVNAAGQVAVSQASALQRRSSRQPVHSCWQLRLPGQPRRKPLIHESKLHRTE